MEYIFPKPDYRRSDEWMWPHLDFDMDAEDLFTTLHDRFNTHTVPLQNPTAFYDDVREIARKAKSREELYSMLEERKNQRVKEMNKGLKDVRHFITVNPRLMGCPICYDEDSIEEKIPPGSLNDSVAERSFAAFQATKFGSFDSLVAFFDGFVRDERKKEEDRRRKLDERWARLRERRKRKAIASSAFEEATEEATEEALRHKRRRTMSESDGDDDTLKPAAQQYQSKATEPTAPTSKQAEKRKQPSDLHEQDGARSKRPKLYHSTEPVGQGPSMFAASYYSPSNPLGGLNHSSTFAASYSPNNPLGAMSHSHPRRDEDKSGWASEIPQSPPFDYSEMFYIRRLPPREIEELPDTDPPVYTADTKRSREPLRANGRQPVDKGHSREEPETSSSQKQQPPQDNPSQEQLPQEQPPQEQPPQEQPPQEQPPLKKPPQKKRRERKTSPTIERVLRSRRSSRRSTGQDLLFLGDDATPHVASRKRKL